jgi:hypothetical protein
MSTLDLVSTMQFGEASSLRTFFNSHNIVHQLYASKIVTASIQVPSFDVSDQSACDDLVAMQAAVLRKERPPQPVTINNWLAMHMTLHRGEMIALGLGDPVDISSVDFRIPSQFYDWLLTHLQMHDAEDAALGL